MDPILLISGALALLGGGAGALAWYRKNYPVAPADGPGYTIPPVAAGQDPDTLAAGFVNLAGGSIATVDSSGNVSVNAGVISPYINPGRSTVVGFTPPATTPAPTPTTGAGLIASTGFSGLEAHI